MTISTPNIVAAFQVDFPVHKLLSGKTVWLSRILPEGLSDDQGRPQGKTAFFQRFGYAIAGASWTKSLQFDLGEQKIYRAERYGGAGIGQHGGGVRVGNDGGFQIKGIGRNPLCGSVENTLHSYGALNAGEAIYEAIYASVLNKIMPVGAIPIHGVIATGADSAYYDYDDKAPHNHTVGWGALLVRDGCVRPSHFLRAGLYSAEQAASMGIASDMARTRATNKMLLRAHGSTNGFIMYLGKFLQNCANQFAFAHMARIAHGTLSASNIALDGRWVDLACTTFVRSGENSGYKIPFYQEPQAIFPILKELTDGYAKYNQVDLNIQPLVRYYHEMYRGLLDVHLAYVLGIDHAQLSDDVKNGEYGTLAGQARRIIGSAREVSVGYPCAAPAGGDPIAAWVEQLFRGLAMREGKAARHAAHADDAPGVAAFLSVMRQLQERQDLADTPLFFQRAAIVAMKRALLPEFYFKGRLDQRIRLLLDQGRAENFGAFIDQAVDVADWAFTAPQGHVWLYKGGAVSIAMCADTGRLHVTDGQAATTYSAQQMRTAFERLFPHGLDLLGFDFKPYLTRLLAVLAAFEDAQHD